PRPPPAPSGRGLPARSPPSPAAFARPRSPTPPHAAPLPARRPPPFALLRLRPLTALCPTAARPHAFDQTPTPSRCPFRPSPLVADLHPPSRAYLIHGIDIRRRRA